MASWDDFGLHPHLINTLRTVYGYQQPTDVQIELLKYQNTRMDLLTASKTGSGKTFCYILPILSKIFYEIEGFEETKGEALKQRNTQIDALIFLPTRDLAIQVYKEFQKFMTDKFKKVGLSLVIGGLSKEKQIKMLNKCPRVVISTPGRLWDFIQNENILNLRLLAGICFLVLDEVDRIIELGQFDELSKILNFIYKEALREQEIIQQNFIEEAPKEYVEFEGKQLEVIIESDIGQKNVLSSEQIVEAKRRANNRRTFIVSATLTKISGTSRMMTNKKFRSMMKKIKKKNKDKDMEQNGQVHPKIIDIMNKLDTKNKLKIVDLTQNLGSFLPTGLTIDKIRCTTQDKIYYSYHFLKQQKTGLSMVFVNSINAARKLKNILECLHIGSVTLHSHMRQAQRIKTLQNFESGKKKLLITTDVGARGLDIENVNLVLHYHLPRDFDTFVHRCGRTARANKIGRAVIICDADDQKRLMKYVREFPKETIQNIDLGYNEVYDDKPLIEKAMEVERKSHSYSKGEKEKKWMIKASKDIGVDEFAIDGLTNKGKMRKRKSDIESDDDSRNAIKTGKQEVIYLKKRYEDMFSKEKLKTQKKFSSFLNPFEIQEIAEKLKRVK
jgi:ATP-dependent RNA helicase DDX24/MAK5